MATVPVKVKSRFADGLKKYKPILTKAEKQDLNESDTVTIIVDMLSDLFGYDKYDDITSEFAIKKTFWKHILFKRIVCVFNLSKK